MAHRKRHNLPEPEFLKPKQKNLSGVGNAEITVKTIQGTVEKLKEGEYLKTVTEKVKVKRANPAYVSKEMEIQKVEDRMTILENERNRLIKRYTGILNNYPDLKSTLGGAALGSSLAAITDKSKTKNVERILWFGLLGGAIGYTTHQITKPTEQQKAKELHNIKLKVDQINNELTGHNIELHALKWDLNGMQKNILDVKERSKQVVAKKEEAPIDLSKLDQLIKVPAAQPTPRVKEKELTISLADFQKKDLKSIPFDREYLELVGEPKENFAWMIWGEKGNGKSTFALKLANYLANNHGTVLYNASEEKLEKSLQRKTKQFQSEFLILGQATTLDQLKRVLQNPKYRFVIIDSINDMAITPIQLKEVREEYPKRAFIWIMQATKSGVYMGNSAFGHDADIITKVVNFEPVMEKTRFK